MGFKSRFKLQEAVECNLHGSDLAHQPLALEVEIRVSDQTLMFGRLNSPSNQTATFILRNMSYGCCSASCCNSLNHTANTGPLPEVSRVRKTELRGTLKALLTTPPDPARRTHISRLPGFKPILCKTLWILEQSTCNHPVMAPHPSIQSASWTSP